MENEQPPPYSEPAPPGFNPLPPNQPLLQPMYEPPLQSMHVDPETPTNVVITTVAPMHFGPNTQIVTCPSCRVPISTEVKTEPNQRTHLYALLLCLFQCYCCCFIPYCVDSCQSQNHYCPECHAFLGAYQNY